MINERNGLVECWAVTRNELHLPFQPSFGFKLLFSTMKYYLWGYVSIYKIITIYVHEVMLYIQLAWLRLVLYLVLSTSFLAQAGAKWIPVPPTSPLMQARAQAIPVSSTSSLLQSRAQAIPVLFPPLGHRLRLRLSCSFYLLSGAGLRQSLFLLPPLGPS